MNRKKSFLILTSDSGFGHRHAANAVASAFAQKYGEDCETRIVNPIIEQNSPAILQAAEMNYDRNVLHNPEFYRFTYEISDSRQASSLVENTLKLALYRNVEQLILEMKPDGILNTNQMFNAPAGAAIAKQPVRIPFFTVVTDLANVHSMWFNNAPDRFFVASEYVKNKAMSCGIPESKITISGIPVDPAFATNTLPKSEIRTSMGLQPNLFTILFIGSPRVSGIFEHMEALESINASFQVSVVAGGDDRLYEQIIQRQWKFPVVAKNFVHDIPNWMKCADVLVTKAGGLVLSEALAAGLPILLIDHLPGQEEGNVRFILDHKAGLRINDLAQFTATLTEWMNKDPDQLRKVADNSRKLGNPNSAYFIADALWNAPLRSRTSYFPNHPIARMF